MSRSSKPTAAERHDTWDAGWEERLSSHVRAAGFTNVWEYVRHRPGEGYSDLAEGLAHSGGFGVAPIQIERLQVRDTPEKELRSSLRDSLQRHLRGAFQDLGWRQGPYWESRAIGALGAWAAMWSPRVDVSAMKQRIFEAGPPEGWSPTDDRDRFLREAVPD